MDSSSYPNGYKISSSTCDYLVESCLGQGSSGTVFRCLKKPSNEVVALKIVSIFIKEAKEEVKILNYLKDLGSEHFHIASCNDSFMFEGNLCIEFTMLDISLAAYIQERGKLPLEEIRPILHQMAEALNFLKDAGVVHADLNPSNIMLVDRDAEPLQVQLIDFGVAIRNPLEKLWEYVGNLWYNPPEILLGHFIDYTFDVWSLGCVAVEMLTGRPLFQGDEDDDMIRQIVSIIEQPPDKLLDYCPRTEDFFNGTRLGQGWTLKSSGDMSPRLSTTEWSQDNLRKQLHDIFNVPGAIPPEADPAIKLDQDHFMDLVGQMLNTDYYTRITASGVLSHPFLTLDYLKDKRDSSYVNVFEAPEDCPALEDCPDPEDCPALEDCPVPEAYLPLKDHPAPEDCPPTADCSARGDCPVPKACLPLKDRPAAEDCPPIGDCPPTGDCSASGDCPVPEACPPLKDHPAPEDCPPIGDCPPTADCSAPGDCPVPEACLPLKDHPAPEDCPPLKDHPAPEDCPPIGDCPPTADCSAPGDCPVPEACLPLKDHPAPEDCPPTADCSVPGDCPTLKGGPALEDCPVPDNRPPIGDCPVPDNRPAPEEFNAKVPKCSEGFEAEIPPPDSTSTRRFTKVMKRIRTCWRNFKKAFSCCLHPEVEE